MSLSSEVIRGHHRSSEVIRGHQRSSEVIRRLPSMPRRMPRRSSTRPRGHRVTRLTIPCNHVLIPPNVLPSTTCSPRPCGCRCAGCSTALGESVSWCLLMRLGEDELDLEVGVVKKRYYGRL
jgi:hypothetical protein